MDRPSTNHPIDFWKRSPAEQHDHDHPLRNIAATKQGRRDAIVTKPRHRRAPQRLWLLWAGRRRVLHNCCVPNIFNPWRRKRSLYSVWSRLRRSLSVTLSVSEIFFMCFRFCVHRWYLMFSRICFISTKSEQTIRKIWHQLIYDKKFKLCKNETLSQTVINHSGGFWKFPTNFWSFSENVRSISLMIYCGFPEIFIFLTEFELFETFRTFWRFSYIFRKEISKNLQHDLLQF